MVNILHEFKSRECETRYSDILYLRMWGSSELAYITIFCPPFKHMKLSLIADFSSGVNEIFDLLR